MRERGSDGFYLIFLRDLFLFSVIFFPFFVGERVR